MKYVAKSSNELRTQLRSIDHKGYPAYKSLAGSYQFGSYVLVIDHVQGDPFASPSSLHVEVPHKNAGFPAAARNGGIRSESRGSKRFRPVHESGRDILTALSNEMV